jgi:hypothetical protein
VVNSTVNILFHLLNHSDTNQHLTISVLLQHANRTATPMDWSSAYADDSNTNFILQHLALEAPWNQVALN